MNNNFYQRAMRSLQSQNQNRYSNVYGNGYGENPDELSAPDLVFGLVTTSTTDASSTALLFGQDTNGDGNDAGNGTGLANTGIGNRSHGFYKRFFTHTPHLLQELRLRASSAAAMPTTLTLTYTEAGGGQTLTKQIFPRVYLTSQTEDNTRVEIPLNGVILNSKFELTFPVAANATIDSYFITKAIVDSSRALKGKGAIVATTEGAPVGGAAQRIIVENKGLVR